MLDGTSVTEPPLGRIELPVTVIGLMGLLKVTLTPALVPMLVDELGGATAVIVGATVVGHGPRIEVRA